jgi:uncharacterized protein YqeY
MIDQVDSDITSALKGGDRTTASALKMLKNALANARIAKNDVLTEEEDLRVVRKEIKSRVEARDLYATNNRQELAAKEEFERSLFSRYVPVELTQNQLDDAILSASQSMDGTKEFSKLMPATIKIVSGRVDGKTVSEAVKKFIGDNK